MYNIHCNIQQSASINSAKCSEIFSTCGMNIIGEFSKVLAGEADSLRPSLFIVSCRQNNKKAKQPKGYRLCDYT